MLCEKHHKQLLEIAEKQLLEIVEILIELDPDPETELGRMLKDITGLVKGHGKAQFPIDSLDEDKK